MKILARDVFEAYQALEITKQRAVPMPDKAKYWLARLGRKLRPEFQQLCEQRDELITSYGKKNEAGQFHITLEDQDDFTRRWTETTSVEIELAEVDPRPLSFFRVVGSDPGSDGPLSVLEMTSLDPFLLDE